MAFYYVKTDGANDGTATGDGGRYASKQTGAFSGLGVSGYYATIALAEGATTPPVSGDFILVSDAHSLSSGGTITYTGTATGGYVLVLTVSDTAIDAAGSSRGAEQTTGVADLIFLNDLSHKGMEYLSIDNITFGGLSANIFDDCRIGISSSGSVIFCTSDGIIAKFNNTEVVLDHASSTISIAGASSFHMYGGAVTTISAGITSLISGTANNAGAIARFIGVDLSSVSGTLVNGMGGSRANDDLIDIVFDRCKLASGVAFVGESLLSYNQRILLTRCSNVSAEAEHQYSLTSFSGTVIDDDVIRRADDEPFTDSGTNISYKIETSANCQPGSPLWFDYPTVRWSALSSASTDTLRFFIASTVALTSQDVWVEVVYPDGTTKELGNFISTRGFPLDADTLTTDAGSDWRDGAGAFTGNEYQIDVDTSGDVGADSYPTVRMHCSKASTTLYIASEYDLV